MSGRGVGGRGRGVGVGGKRPRASLDGFARRQVSADDDAARDEMGDDDDAVFRQQMRSQSSEVTKDGCLKQALAIAFGDDDEDEMNVDSVEFSLICPYSRTRMVRPVSCVECSHIQCMDMDSAVRVLLTGRSMKNPRGACPRCGRTVRLSQMYVNPWMASLLAAFPSNDHLVLTPDGRVQPKGVSAAVASREVFDCSTQDVAFSPIVVKSEPTGRRPSVSVGGNGAALGGNGSGATLGASSALLGSSAAVAGPSSLLDGPYVTRPSDGDSRMFPSEGASSARHSPPQGHAAPPVAEAAPPTAWAVATFEGLDPEVSTSQHGPPPTPSTVRTPSSFFSVLPTLTSARRLNRGIIGRDWVAVCPICGARCTEQHDPDTGVLEEGCCGRVAPRSEWPLRRVAGDVVLQLQPDDMLLLVGAPVGCFVGKLMHAGFFPADDPSGYSDTTLSAGPKARSGFFYGPTEAFGRYELDYVVKMCEIATAGGAEECARCAKLYPTPELFRDWPTRSPSALGGGGGGGNASSGSRGYFSQSQAPSLTPTPYGAHAPPPPPHTQQRGPLW